MMNNIPELDIRPPLADLVFDRLRAAIIARDLIPGSQLTEQGLAEQLNISKTPVREALLRLRQVGLIEPDGKRGMRVVKLSLDELRQATELRAVLEGHIAGRAADLATKSQARRIVRAAEDSLDAAEEGNNDGFHEHDRVFHSIVGEAANNARIKQCADDTASLIHTVMVRDAFPTSDHLTECARTHVRIGQAIADKDSQTAAEEMRKHIWRVYELMLQQEQVLDDRALQSLRPLISA